MVKHIYEMNDNEIDLIILKYLPIRNTEKNKFGEVFTPVELINLIIDKLPMKAWSNPHAKWLEPASGIGNFMIIIYKRLMEGLKTWQTNKKKRSQHIIQNMLYMVEFNKENCNISKSIFGPLTNINCGDFLDEKTLFHNFTFDYIVGNPPFQDDFGNNNKRILGGKSKLYERIFLKAFLLLKHNGYLSFITPDNIFSGNTINAYNTLIQNHVQFISFDSINLYFPNIQQYMCYFILHKNARKHKTKILNSHSNLFSIQLTNRPVNPIRNWTLNTEKLTNQYISNHKNNAVYNRGKPISQYKGNKYNIVYTPDKYLHTNNIQLAVGYGQPKIIIFSISTKLQFKMDYNGVFGVGPNTFYIPFYTKKQGKQLEHFFNSTHYKTLAVATKTTRQFLKIAFIQHLNIHKIFKTNKSKKIHKNTTSKTKTKKNKI